MKKRNLFVLLAALGLMLTACGQKKDDTPKKDDEQQTPDDGGQQGEDVVHVISVTVTPATLTLEPTQTGNLEASVLPTNATDKTLTWSSSNTGVATVANGVVTAVAAGTATITATADGKSGTCTVTVNNPAPPAPVIDHQDPFVSNVTDPSLTRAFREEFDTMIEDFSSATPTGTTTGAFTGNLLRVLVDSEDTNEPQSPDAAIYKMATGVREIHNYEGIGFRMRAVGNKALNYSNLVLGLRGSDDWKVYPLNLADALDPDQEELPALTDQFQDIIISPQQSLDANTVYELATGGNSEQAVLGKILGFHLYALDEECSAVLEIENVFLYEAGEKTILDNFSREKVNKTDDTCWWRDSTGFIVQKGVTLKGASYTTKAIELGDYENIVMNVMGDTSGLKINNVAYSALKDADNHALTGAVNGAFMPYVINLANSGLELSEGKLVFESTTEVVISQIFLSNLINEAPVTEYPLIDIANASYLTKFEATKAAGSIKTNYDDAAADTETNTALDTNYVIAWAGTELISMDGHNLVLAEDENEGLVNLVIGSKAEVKDYLVIAIRATSNPASLRFKLGTSEVINLSNCVAGPGLPTVPAEPGYPYILDNGFGLLIIDLERSGFANVNNEINIFYNGDTKVEIDSIFFADAYKAQAQVEETVMFEKEIEAGEGYAYVDGYDLPADAKYVHVLTDAAVANELRFEGNDGAKWLKDGAIIDINGDVVADGSTDYIIDLEASGLKAPGVGNALHTHSSKGATAFSITLKLYTLIPAVEVTETPLFSQDIEAGEGYAYVNGADLPADAKYVHVITDAAVANEIRFEGTDGAKWLKDAAVIDIDGNPVADGSTDYIIDLEASGLKVAGAASALHVHSSKGSAAFNVTLKLYSVSPVKHIVPGAVMFDKTIEAGSGYAYVEGYDLPANARYVKVETNAAVANEIRFEGTDGAKWLKDGDIIDMNGNPVADGSTEYIIDLEASGLKVAGAASALHVHSSKGASEFTIKLTLVNVYVDGSYAHLLSAYAG